MYVSDSPLHFQQIYLSNSARRNSTLSVIVRSHKEERLPFLSQALFSLAIQYWRDLEVVITLQNGTEKFKNQVHKLIERQPFHQTCNIRVLNIEIPSGIDGRSTLLNRGIKDATGRYLAFLDDDDVIYQHGYKTLIEQLASGNAPIAVGGCRIANLKNESGSWYIQGKATPFKWGRNRFDLLQDNFIPIHSYVIDRNRVDESDLYFDDEFPLLEDYEFLLRLSSKYGFDFSKLDTAVCEYRVHDSNSLPVYTKNASPELNGEYTRAFELINERKKHISFTLPASDLLNILTKKNSFASTGAEVVEALNGETNGPENPQIVRKIFYSAIDKTYDFFTRYPHIERALSKTVHFGWRIYSRFSHPASNNGHG